MTQPKKPELIYLAINQLIRGRYQPRDYFHSDSLNELADSIRSSGIIQPIVVRSVSKNKYEIIAGERRWRAAQLVGLTTVPCILNEYNDREAAAITMIENINRVDLNAIEEAKAYQRIVKEFNYSHEELALILGKSRAKITNALRLLKLNPEVQKYITEGLLTEGHGKILAALSEEKQINLALKTVQKNLNVRQLENMIKDLNRIQSDEVSKKNVNIIALETKLSEHLGSPVKINYENTTGEITINFHDLEILQGVLKKMGFDPNQVD